MSPSKTASTGTQRKADLPKTMKAMVFYEKEKMRLEEIEVPRPKINEVLLAVKTVGICGSDVAYYFGKSPLETPHGQGTSHPWARVHW